MPSRRRDRPIKDRRRVRGSCRVVQSAGGEAGAVRPRLGPRLDLHRPQRLDPGAQGAHEELAAKSTVLLKNAPRQRQPGAAAPPPNHDEARADWQGRRQPYGGRRLEHVPSPPDLVSPLDAFRAAGSRHGSDGSDAGAAAAAAKAADVAIVFGYATSGEGDRKDLSLEDNIDALVPAVAAANPRRRW